jgi:osmotically-inducible protein OsmY
MESARGDASTSGSEQSTGADNTRNNDRDKSGAVTPLHQGSGAADMQTTQAIRKALIADDTLSSDAKNIKVITADGVVTLRGPVKNDQERRTIERKAAQLAGSNRIDSNLDVESK